MEFKPCEHTLTLDQSGAQKIPDKSLAHCQECDLKANLWLCMTCGHLGCGRKNYDGTGGNGHGLEHFQTTGHCVNVKIGTITPEGKAAIHCYSCDEEVVDPELAAHLGVLGIEITNQVKTEKNMAELNLEMNLNATLSKQLEDGKELIQVWGPMNTGIQNLGNSCYMNSVLQVLFSQEEFRNKYSANAEDHLNNCKKYTPECFQCQIQKLGLGLICGKYSQKSLADKYITEENGEVPPDTYFQEGIKPQIFKTLIGKGHPEFQTGQQQDVLEYFMYLLDKIMKAEKQAKAADPGKIFEFEMERRTQCTQCHRVTYKTSKENHLYVRAICDSKVEEGTKINLSSCLE